MKSKIKISIKITLNRKMMVGHLIKMKIMSRMCSTTETNLMKQSLTRMIKMTNKSQINLMNLKWSAIKLIMAR